MVRLKNKNNLKEAMRQVVFLAFCSCVSDERVFPKVVKLREFIMKLSRSVVFI